MYEDIWIAVRNYRGVGRKSPRLYVNRRSTAFV